MADVLIGRLAMRVEAERWVAYYAPPNSMEDAIFLGSIHMGAVRNNEVRKLAFMVLMQDVLNEYLFAATGSTPTWGGPERAPESERSGSG